MSTLNELIEGLTRRCETIHGLRAYPVMHPKPEPPCVCIGGPVRWTYNETMEGYWQPVFELWVYVNAADLYRAQQALFTYLAPSGSRSIPAKIHEESTLGGVCDTARVIGSLRPPVEVEVAGGRQLHAAVEVEVLAM